MDTNVTEVQPIVRISEDGMDAYITLPRSPLGTAQKEYDAKTLILLLQSQGVVCGIDQEAVLSLVKEPVYGTEIWVAGGSKPTEGTPGSYEYFFETTVNTKPKILKDGSVDYRAMKTFENIQSGDKIALYHPAVQGKSGRTVRGKELFPTRMRDLTPLAGNGIERAEDGVTYYAKMDGQITLKKGRIIISPLYEVRGNVGVDIGNIDFRGDIVIHGTIKNDVMINATGNVTVDGLVENCTIHAGKDIFLLSGVKGSEKTVITADGSISAQFIEFAEVNAGGDISAEVFFQSRVTSDGIITVSGNHASVLGGSMSAVEGIEAYSLGNDFGVITNVFAGITPERIKQREQLQHALVVLQNNLQKIKDGLNKFDELGEERGISYREDPRRMQLLRVKIRDEAVLGEGQVRLDNLCAILERGKHARIRVKDRVYPGVRIVISDRKLDMKECQESIEFIRTDEGIRMEHL